MKAIRNPGGAHGADAEGVGAGLDGFRERGQAALEGVSVELAFEPRSGLVGAEGELAELHPRTLAWSSLEHGRGCCLRRRRGFWVAGSGGRSGNFGLNDGDRGRPLAWAMIVVARIRGIEGVGAETVLGNQVVISLAVGFVGVDGVQVAESSEDSVDGGKRDRAGGRGNRQLLCQAPRRCNESIRPRRLSRSRASN